MLHVLRGVGHERKDFDLVVTSVLNLVRKLLHIPKDEMEPDPRRFSLEPARSKQLKPTEVHLLLCFLEQQRCLIFLS